MQKYNLPKWKYKLYAYILIVFWVFAILMLIASSFEDLATVIANPDQAKLSLFYNYRVRPYIPNIIKDNYLTDEAFSKASAYIFSLFSSTISTASFFLFSGILIIPLMFYLNFRRKDSLIKELYSLVPEKYFSGFRRATQDISKQLHDFYRAKVVESIIVGSICCLGFFVAGLKGWLILGFFAGFFNIVPYLGPVFGAIPPIIIGLLDEPITAFYVFITIIISQLIDNFYLIPFMVTSKVKIDALCGIVLILIGAKLLGILGMIFAIPIYLVYKIVLVESYNELVRIHDNPSK
jgi:predicted PurR-regulated permease PerM